MKKIFLLLLTVLSFNSYSQTKGNDSIATAWDYPFIEIMPEFPGEISEFIAKHQSHPTDDENTILTGKVVVRFYVLETGKISDITVVRKVHPKLDTDAVSIIEKMPLWKPGKAGDKIIKTLMTLPITYK